MTGPLADRVVAVTGAGRGLGLLTVAELLAREARVVANHRADPGGLTELAGKYPDALRLVAGDIGDEPTAERLVAAAREWGRLDALVHNAGIARDQALVRTPVGDWDEVIRVNLRGGFLATKHAVRAMMRRRYGRLIYLSSISAVAGVRGQSAYAASKAALHGLALAVAQEYADYGIRTVVLAPGMVDAGMGTDAGDDRQRHFAERSLLGRGSAASIAGTIAFLAGPDADYINAEVIRADGGQRT